MSFEDGRITQVGDHAATAVEDFGDNYILPGLIDSHIHINEPGRTEWEGFETATRAAAAGGYTCLIDMPLNCIPSTTDLGALAQKRAVAAGKAFVDYRFWGGAVQGNSGDLKALAAAGVAGFKCFMVHPGTDEFSTVTEEDLRVAMPIIARGGLPLLVHAELPGPIDEAARQLTGADMRWYANYLLSRPDSAEVEAIRLIIRLCREYGCRVHIVHLATGSALADLRTARVEGLPITVETCPHYLFFSAEEIPDGDTAFKCAPPIRGKENRELLWKALQAGEIDLIATDHSPCPPELKRTETGDFKAAWGGIASVSLALSAVWTAASKRGIALAEVVRWMAERPAVLAGATARKGRIVTGLDADFVIFDADAKWEVKAEDLHFRHKLSPYMGHQLRGRVEATFLRGKCVYSDGRFGERPGGREIQ